MCGYAEPWQYPDLRSAAFRPHQRRLVNERRSGLKPALHFQIRALPEPFFILQFRRFALIKGMDLRGIIWLASILIIPGPALAGFTASVVSSNPFPWNDYSNGLAS